MHFVRHADKRLNENGLTDEMRNIFIIRDNNITFEFLRMKYKTISWG